MTHRNLIFVPSLIHAENRFHIHNTMLSLTIACLALALGASANDDLFAAVSLQPPPPDV